MTTYSTWIYSRRSGLSQGGWTVVDAGLSKEAMEAAYEELKRRSWHRDRVRLLATEQGEPPVVLQLGMGDRKYD